MTLQTAAVSQQSDWSDGFSEGVEISDGTETFVSASEAGDNTDWKPRPLIKKIILRKL